MCLYITPLKGQGIRRTGGCAICGFWVLGGETRSVKTWLNWTKLVGLEVDGHTYNTPWRMKAWTYGWSHHLWFLDVGLQGEVCQNLIKSNIVSVIRSEYTYLYHPLNDKSTGVRGVGLFAISGCWMVRRGPCHCFCSLDYFTRWSFHLLLQLICTLSL